SGRPADGACRRPAATDESSGEWAPRSAHPSALPRPLGPPPSRRAIRLASRDEHHGDGKGHHAASQERSPALVHELLPYLCFDAWGCDEQTFPRVAADRAVEIPELIGTLDLVLIVAPGDVDVDKPGVLRQLPQQRRPVEPSCQRRASRHLDGPADATLDDSIEEISRESAPTQLTDASP